jgi:hypothetical protein
VHRPRAFDEQLIGLLDRSVGTSQTVSPRMRCLATSCENAYLDSSTRPSANARGVQYMLAVIDDEASRVRRFVLERLHTDWPWCSWTPTARAAAWRDQARSPGKVVNAMPRVPLEPGATEREAFADAHGTGQSSRPLLSSN